MAKRNPWAAVVGATVIAGGSFLGKKLKGKDKKKDTGQVADAEVINTDATAETPKTSTERKCPSCGNIDTSGSKNCPLCFAVMSDTDFVDDI